MIEVNMRRSDSHVNPNQQSLRRLDAALKQPDLALITTFAFQPVGSLDEQELRARLSGDRLACHCRDALIAADRTPVIVEERMPGGGTFYSVGATGSSEQAASPLAVVSMPLAERPLPPHEDCPGSWWMD